MFAFDVDMLFVKENESDMKIRSQSTDTQAEEKIRQLAHQHGVDATPTNLDEWADKIAELSGQENDHSDEVEQLLINLRRAGVITPQYSRELFAEYMESKYGYR